MPTFRNPAVGLVERGEGLGRWFAFDCDYR